MINYTAYAYHTLNKKNGEQAGMQNQQPEHEFRERLLLIQNKLRELEAMDRAADPLNFDILNSDPE